MHLHLAGFGNNFNCLRVVKNHESNVHEFCIACFSWKKYEAPAIQGQPASWCQLSVWKSMTHYLPSFPLTHCPVCASLKQAFWESVMLWFSAWPQQIYLQKANPRVCPSEYLLLYVITGSIGFSISYPPHASFLLWILGCWSWHCISRTCACHLGAFYFSPKLSGLASTQPGSGRSKWQT